MVSVREVLSYLYSGLSVSIFPMDGSPVAAASPPPEMSGSDLFTLIRADKGLQINLLALISTLLIGFQLLLVSRRRRSASGNMITVILVWVPYGLSFPVFVYTAGLIQSVEAPERIDSQLLWAVGLLLLQGSVDGISAISRHDVKKSKGLQAVVVLWLLVSRSDVSGNRWILLMYFLFCWVYSVMKFAQRITALRKASSEHGLVRSAKVVADYMEDIYSASGSSSASDYEIHDMMAKCKYLVLGEEKDSIPPSSMAPYRSKVGGKGKVVTFDMIWNSKDKLLSSDDEQTRALKDTCLSFALFKLLKRRFCGLDIVEKGDPKALEFVLAHGEHAFHLVEVELSFLCDFFYTKYPALFPSSPALSVVRFVVLLGLLKVLLLDFSFKVISSTILSDGQLPRFRGYSGPAVIFIFFNNILVVFMILSMDILQDVVTGYSNWAIVHYVCDYVMKRRTDRDGDGDGDGRKGWWMAAKRWWERGFGIRSALIKWVAARRARKPSHWWNNVLGQYTLLNYKTNAFSLLLTLRLMEKTGEARKREEDVTLTAEIKTALLSSLRESGGRLSVGRSDELRDKMLPLHWAPLDLPTSTHTVLVWHIATTICACADQDTSDELPSRLVATTLSRYCAYLLAFVPDMLPDNNYKASQILDAVILDARERLGKIESLSDRCSEMLQLKAPDRSREVQDTSILVLGADLGRQLLLENRKRPPWDMLAVFWADLVLFLALSDNTDIHTDCLVTGGEFMTHLWTLLTHAGIVDRPDIHAASHA